MHDADVPWLRAVTTDLETAWRWRFQSEIPGVERFLAAISEGVLTQFIAELLDETDGVGLFTAYSANFRDGYAFLAVLLTPTFYASHEAVEAFALFVGYLFRMFPFRKLYMHVPDLNLSMPGHARIASMFECEGVMKQATYLDGAYRDIRLLTINRDVWEATGARLVPRS
jgi:hypothetical protein